MHQDRMRGRTSRMWRGDVLGQGKKLVAGFFAVEICRSFQMQA